MYFFLLGNAYIWQDVNDLRRKPMKLILFSIVVSLALISGQALTIDSVGSKQPVNGQTQGNLSKLLTILQSSLRTSWFRETLSFNG
jgi:hypothetical protein